MVYLKKIVKFFEGIGLVYFKSCWLVLDNVDGGNIFVFIEEVKILYLFFWGFSDDCIFFGIFWIGYIDIIIFDDLLKL